MLPWLEFITWINENTYLRNIDIINSKNFTVSFWNKGTYEVYTFDGVAILTKSFWRILFFWRVVGKVLAQTIL